MVLVLTVLTFPNGAAQLLVVAAMMLTCVMMVTMLPKMASRLMLEVNVVVMILPALNVPAFPMVCWLMACGSKCLFM